MPETTFTGPDLTTFLGLDALGLTAVGQLLTPRKAVVECRMQIGFEDPLWLVGRRSDAWPMCRWGWISTQLVVCVWRFACTHCRRVWRQDTTRLAQPRARLTRSAVEWRLRALGLEPMSVSRVAQALGISWHAANSAILTRAEQTITGDPDRFDGVEVLGVDEHAWRHTRRGDRYVTVIIDLTPVRHQAGPVRLLDVAPGPNKILKTWLAQRDQDWRQRVEVVAMDGFTGSGSAAGEELPTARAVMDPYARRVPSRRQARPVPPHPTPNHGTPRPGGGPALPGQAHAAHRSQPAHRCPGRAP